ncbi:hypothetical protein [Yoonia sp. 208BN28-4]|uniref:hypothetical protein n=1 Tax=Yoonia sp. 208BN28-4 TaxID=3126505 RepID=UPI00309AC507
MTRRRINMVLHWSVVLLVLAMMKGSAGDPIIRWALVTAGAVWTVIAIVKGPLARPGPKLGDGLKRAYRPAHIGLYGILALTIAAQAAALLGYTDQLLAWYALLILFGAGMFHALFQLWRHTALYDGALRTITPRIWHKHL